MKLRIRDNSVGLRLTQDEVEVLRKQGVVSARTGFPGGRELRYELESSPASVAPAAFFSDNVLTVRLPETTVIAWAATEQVAIEGEQVLVDGEKLAIVVEKDFDGCTRHEEHGEGRS
ncbi:MAG: hypothetical protein OEV10_04515 [Gammaproteobacteria bacterium]|nr:hypothetical protein [Gammaproteobacteria bacterium]MDH3863212.1 hypothetical protein [Gammaproteobacteria bacterium]MDH3953650.1 hypothetical protein [Gammaproteobacteria bacterium]MDH4005857.1 hypothetical protein [Gammaproteobacteria bacterium]NCF58742.1 hypothetical protein [Gammaproteobacteria bacterium]